MMPQQSNKFRPYSNLSQMIQNQAYIALDCGAESARVMVGILQQGQLQLEEIHRFPTGGISVGESLRWDVLQIFEDIRIGVCKAAQLNSTFCQ